VSKGRKLVGMVRRPNRHQVDTYIPQVPYTMVSIARPENLRGSTLDFRNLTNYIARRLLETGGVRP
jgi:hypothetical protein